MKKMLLAAFLLSGVSALVYEVVWLRPLQLIFGSTTYAFSMILGAFMMGLGIGSLIASRFADRFKNPLAVYAILEVGIAVYGILSIMILNLMPLAYMSIYPSFFYKFGEFFSMQFLLAFLALLIPTSLMGAAFPIVAKSYADENIGESIGTLYSVNVLGAVIGSAAAGFALIPLLGIKITVVFAALVNVSVAVMIFLSEKQFPSHLGRYLYVLLAAFMILLILSPSYDVNLMSSGAYFHLPKATIEYGDRTEYRVDVKSFLGRLTDGTEVLFYKESLYETVAVKRVCYNPTCELATVTMSLNGKNQCSFSTATTDRRDVLVTWLLGYLPSLLHDNPKTALNIGFGCGWTADALRKYGYDRIDSVEIDPAVVEASKYFEQMNRRILDYDKHNLIIADARHYLKTTDNKYDVIVSQPSDPFLEKASNLFSKEFFETAKSRLNDGGIYAQWFPVKLVGRDEFKSYYKTFSSVFPYVYIFAEDPEARSELIIIGSLKKIDPLEYNATNIDVWSDLKLTGIESSDSLKSMFMISGENVPKLDAPLITDDRPVIELAAARNMYVPQFDTVKLIDEWGAGYG